MWEIVNAFHCRLYLLISCIVTLWAQSSLLNVMHFRPGICMFQYWWCNVAVLLAFPKWHPWLKAFANLWNMFCALIISRRYAPSKTFRSAPDSCKFDDRLRHPRLILCLAYYHTTKALFVVLSDDEFFTLAGILLCHTLSPKWTWLPFLILHLEQWRTMAWLHTVKQHCYLMRNTLQLPISNGLATMNYEILLFQLFSLSWLYDSPS